MWDICALTLVRVRVRVGIVERDTARGERERLYAVPCDHSASLRSA